MRLAVDARDDVLVRAAPTVQVGCEPLVVGASVGPYGAYLADGSEYVGQYGRFGRATLREFHRGALGRSSCLHPASELLACETIPSGVGG